MTRRRSGEQRPATGTEPVLSPHTLREMVADPVTRAILVGDSGGWSSRSRAEWFNLVRQGLITSDAVRRQPAMAALTFRQGTIKYALRHQHTDADMVIGNQALEAERQDASVLNDRDRSPAISSSSG